MDADEYLKLAEVEDRMWYFRALHGHVERELRAAGLAERAAVLDAGCGTGGLLLRARQGWPAWRWTGIDFMPLACELARRRCGPGVEIREGLVTALPLADASFDAVVSVDVLCQVEVDAAAATAEFFRVLRPGGWLIVNVPAYRWMASYHDTLVHTNHRFTRPELAALLAGAGFALRRLSHWNALTFPLILGRRKLLGFLGDASDVKAYPAPVEVALRGLMAAEHAWLERGGNWAWGNSVFAVARKPAS